MSVGIPAQPLGLDPLIAEAKQRARRRRLFAVAVVVASAAAVAIAALPETSSSPQAPAISSLGRAVHDRAPVWDFGSAGGGVTWAINRRDLSVTANDGRTWRTSALPWALRFPGSFGAAQFVDNRHGWIDGVSRSGSDVAYRTTDGGRSWERIGDPPSAGTFAFVSDTRGYVTTYGLRRDELFATSDGGTTWRRVGRLPGSVHGAGLSFLTPQRGFVETRRTVFATYDGGRNWSPILRVAEPVQDTTLWAPTVFGKTLVVPEFVPLADPADGPLRMIIHVSHDNGRSWTVREAPRPTYNLGAQASGPPSFSFTSAKAWVVAGRSALFITTDAGRTWRTVRPGTVPRGSLVHLATGFTSARDGWALFSPPQKPDVLMRTSDGGRHWRFAGPLEPKVHKRG
jgi:photosystem II stability/assembly factor-like uncharacterized protein